MRSTVQSLYAHIIEKNEVMSAGARYDYGIDPFVYKLKGYSTPTNDQFKKLLDVYSKVLNKTNGIIILSHARETNTLKQLILQVDPSLDWFQDPWE